MSGTKYRPAARKVYREEYDNIMAQLNQALLNAPRERQAQRATAAEMQALEKEYKMTPKEKGKRAQQALQRYRVQYGAKRHPISLTQRMWDAIQAGALSDSQLRQVLRFADAEKVREYSMPKSTTQLSAGKQARIRAMLSSGYSYREIADALGVSKSTVEKYVA